MVVTENRIRWICFCAIFALYVNIGYGLSNGPFDQVIVLFIRYVCNLNT